MGDPPVLLMLIARRGGFTMTVSVLLVDDSVTFLHATTQFLEAYEGIVIVGTADNGNDAIKQAEQLRPQVILSDLAMPGLPGLQTIPKLREILPEAGIIALTVMNTNSFRQASLAAGADVFIPKSSMRTDLIPAIQKLAKTDRKQTVKSAPTTLSPTVDTNALALQRILVVEDNVHLCRLFGKALNASGYKVHTATTVQEARDLLPQFRFDVLLCDIHMGDDRGTDLLNEYYEKFAVSGTQVVIVSGESQYRGTCEDMGVDFFLEKPVAVGTLVALVDRLTARQTLSANDANSTKQR
ncbi:MAG: response regulator [Chloroflexi bacterium]|nr:response regulator [Chloroflexota bacterium]